MQTTPERWLPIPGYEGRYDVSDLGRVRSWLPYRGTPVPRIRAASLVNRYLTVCLCRDGGQVTRPLHKLVMLAFVGPRPPKMETRHLDSVERNNHLSNLAYGTKAENMQDSLLHGTNRSARKTHCKRGHPFDEANTLHRKGGGRDCLTCKRASGARYMRAKRAA